MRPRLVALIVPVSLLISVFSFVKFVTHDIKLFEVDILKPVCILKVGEVLQTCSEFLFSVDGDVVSIPKGYVTALDTIPSWYKGIADLSRPDALEAAVIHDYLYSCPGSGTRKETDAIFYHAMIHEGASEYLAGKMYFAVRLFGGRHFNYEKECYPNEERQDWTMHD